MTTRIRRGLAAAALAVAVVATPLLPVAGATAAQPAGRTLQDFAAAGGVQDSPGNLSAPSAGVSRVHLRKGQMNGYKVRSWIDDAQEATLSYEVYVPRATHDNGLSRVDLKLPGLAGSPRSQSPWYASSGGTLQNDSFSVRLHARQSSHYGVGHPWWDAYIYAPYAGGKSFNEWGISVPLTTGRNGAGERMSIPTDRWFEVKIRVALNTPGANDGQLDLWVDGQQGVSLRDVRWRPKGQDTPINMLMAETFFNSPGAPQDSHIDMRNFRISYGPQAEQPQTEQPQTEQPQTEQPQSGQSPSEGQSSSGQTSTGRPSAASTGVVAGTSLSSMAGGTVKTSGLIANKVITGNATFTGDNVTLRNVRVTGHAVFRGTNVTIEDSEFGSWALSGAKNVRATRVEILGNPGQDGLHITSTTAPVSNVVITDSYIANPKLTSGAHYDGIQVRGVTGLTLRNTVVDLGAYQSGYNSALFLEDANGGNRDVTVENSWLLGGGYTISGRGQNVRITGTTIAAGKWGYMNPNTTGITAWSANRNPDGATLTHSGGKITVGATPAPTPTPTPTPTPAPEPTPTPTPQPTPAPSVVYVSDTAWRQVANGWGSVEKDQNNGTGAAGDGGHLAIGTRTYAKGLGTHANSEVVVPVNGASTFAAEIGIASYTSGRGTVVFQVWAGSTKLYDSGVVRGKDAPKAITVDVRGRSEIRLVVTNAGDGSDQDHANWADARLLP